MKNNKQKYQESFARIGISEELENKILNKLEKKRQPKTFFTKPMLALTTLILIIFIGASAVFAKEIIEKYFYSKTKDEKHSVYTHTIRTTGFVEINKNVSLHEGVHKSVEILEKELGIKVLTSTRITNKMANIYMVKKNNHEISSLALKLHDCISDFELNAAGYLPSVDIEINFITQFATKDSDKPTIEIQAFEGMYGIDDDTVERYYLKNLDTDVYIAPYAAGINRLAAFIHNNMLYIINGKIVTQDTMIAILESLK